MTNERARAMEPEDISRLFVELGNAGDAEGMAELYAEDAVMGFPPGQETVGRAAIRAIFVGMLAARPQFTLEEPLPTLRYGDLALTATHSTDGMGARAQVARRQADGTWVRILDRPEARG